MTVAVSQAIKNVFVERCDPHCIAWIRATASLWGMSSEHDLDEPVQLSDEMPLRVRWATVGDSLEIIPDRDVSLKATRNGTPLGVETFVILDCLEAMAKVRGLDLKGK